MKRPPLLTLLLSGLTWPLLAQQLGGVPHAREGFRFAIISDIQIRNPGHRFSTIARQIFGDLSQFENRPAFVIATGDLVDGRSGHSLDCPGAVYDPQYDELFRIMKKHLHPALKFYPVVGNHDYHRAADGSPSGPERYARNWFGRLPFGVSPRNSARTVPASTTATLTSSSSVRGFSGSRRRTSFGTSSTASSTDGLRTT